MKNKSKQLSLENNNLKDKINQLLLKLNFNNNINNESNEVIRLYKKIEELTEKINRYPFILEKTKKCCQLFFFLFLKM